MVQQEGRDVVPIQLPAVPIRGSHTISLRWNKWKNHLFIV